MNLFGVRFVGVRFVGVRFVGVRFVGVGLKYNTLNALIFSNIFVA
jgi:hypothetical protein